MMSLYDFSVKKPITILMITLVVVIIGLVSLSKIPLDLLPKIEIPIAIVSTNYVGAGPQEIEKLVTKPIEGAVATVGNIKDVQSISFEGKSMVIAEFNSGTNMDFATLEMREKVDLIKSFLPSDAGEPIVLKMDPNALPILQVSLYTDEDLGKLQAITEEEIKPRIERIEGVASATITGGTEKEVRIVLDDMEMEKYGLTIDLISQLIGAENLNLPGGKIYKGDKELTLKTVGEFNNIEDLKKLPIPLKSGQVIHLEDIGEIGIVEKEMKAISRIDGKDSLNFSIQKQSGVNTVRVAEAINEELESINKEYPYMDMKVVFDQSEYIKKSIMNVFKNVLIGACLAVIVLYIFLRDLKTTLIISVSIPISMIATFILLYFSNITINVMTMGGLAMGVGMLVDNSIVVLENIYRFNENGYRGDIAAVKGAREVSMAVVASTLTTIIVFLPILFVEGITSTIFKEISLTVTFSLLMSLLIALTLIPMLSSKTLKGKKKKERKDIFFRFFQRVNNFYLRMLKWALGHRVLAVIIAAAIFLGTITPIYMIGGEFFPQIDEGMFMVNISLPEGSPFDETNKVVTQVEEKLSNFSEIDTVFSTVGIGSLVSTSSSSSASNIAYITVVLKNIKDRDKTTFQVADEVRDCIKDISGAKISVDVVSDLMTGLGGEAVNIAIKGDDLDTLMNIGEDVKKIVSGVEGTREIKTNYEEGVPEVLIKLDRDMAAQFGINTYTVANTIRGNVNGKVVSKYKHEGREMDIVIKGQDWVKESIGNLKSLPITNPMGMKIPLGDIAEVTVEKSPVSIFREDQSRVVNVTSQILDRDTESVVEDIESMMKDYSMPYGYSYSFEGQYKEMKKAYSDLYKSLALALVLVFMILASQFESFIQPIVIMLSVPLAFSGGALALLITGKHLSVPAIVGGMILAGIVVNNAIVLVDYINTLRKSGEERDEAILKAGSTRLRPILMTTLTTVLGLIPLAVRKGEGSEIQSPMAITLIGGLILSTILTLVFIPVMYTLFGDLKAKFANEER